MEYSKSPFNRVIFLKIAMYNKTMYNGVFFPYSLITIPESLGTKDPASCHQSNVVWSSVKNRLPVSHYLYHAFQKNDTVNAKYKWLSDCTLSTNFGHLNWSGNKTRQS
jgi:hypothetical protein